MALALNKFQTETLVVTTSNQTAYTAPTGYTAIVLYAHVTNITTSAATFTMTHVRSSTTTEIIKDASVPPSDAYVPLDGKLVLETSDSIKIQGSANTSLKLILSILKQQMPRLLSQANFSNITVASLTTTSVSEVALDVFSKTSFRSVKYQIQVTQGSSYHTAEFIIVHNGSLTFNTEFAIVKTGDSLATFDSDISSNNVRLLVTPASTNSTTFKVIRTSINT